MGGMYVELEAIIAAALANGETPQQIYTYLQDAMEHINGLCKYGTHMLTGDQRRRGPVETA